jgi:hypothetical protein
VEEGKSNNPFAFFHGPNYQVRKVSVGGKFSHRTPEDFGKWERFIRNPRESRGSSEVVDEALVSFLN